MSIPQVQKAVVLQDDMTCAVGEAPVQTPGPGEVLVKNVVAAQNPVDWKALTWGTMKPGQSLGCDFAGVVAAVGAGVTEVKVGDKVAGLVRIANGFTSSFREYTLVNASPLIRIPDNMSYEEAATVPLAIATAVVGLRRLVNFPQPAPLRRSVLVWGGASSVGLYAIQLARLAGYRVITTASPKNHALVKDNGAEVAVNYRAPDVVGQIIRASGTGGVDYVYDAISEKGSVAQSVASLKKDGPRKIGVVSLVADKDVDPSVEYHHILCVALLGSGMQFNGRYIPLDRRDAVFGREFFEDVSLWLKDGHLKANPYTVMPGGLAGVQEGLQYMKAGKVSGTKLVYRIADTPA